MNLCEFLRLRIHNARDNKLAKRKTKERNYMGTNFFLFLVSRRYRVAWYFIEIYWNTLKTFLNINIVKEFLYWKEWRIF